MSVVAKLFVASVTRQAGSPDTVTVSLGAVTRGEENKTWAEATPMAKFEMTIQNPDAAVQFRLGQEFYVTFEATGAPGTLADGHAYEPSDWERKNPETCAYASNQRCVTCGAKRSSHEPELRAKLVDWKP